MRGDIRAFAILAHRPLEPAWSLPNRQMREQFLDAMEPEREKRITIKADPLRMRYEARESASSLSFQLLGGVRSCAKSSLAAG